MRQDPPQASQAYRLVRVHFTVGTVESLALLTVRMKVYCFTPQCLRATRPALPAPHPSDRPHRHRVTIRANPRGPYAALADWVPDQLIPEAEVTGRTWVPGALSHPSPVSSLGQPPLLALSDPTSSSRSAQWLASFLHSRLLGGWHCMSGRVAIPVFCWGMLSVSMSCSLAGNEAYASHYPTTAMFD